MSISNLFHLDYWLAQPFTARGLTLWILVGGFLVLVMAGLVFKILSQYQQQKAQKSLLSRLGSFGITMGFLGLVWMFFRQERAVILAWRFWILLWLIGGIVWLYRLLYYALKRIPEIKAEEIKRANLEKYLPKKN
ncbi:MAG TPA: hypothetical protein VLK22_03695 [Candidatus Udaeobacter sp.]|nr:hypothetical protein [Candidatus Udaeobacter sp.]